MSYRYQEYQDGIHNFNDNWLLSLGVCDISKHIQVMVLVLIITLSINWENCLKNLWNTCTYSCPRLLNNLSIIVFEKAILATYRVKL